MMRRRFGRIIGITSVVGVTGNPGQANYTATKAGMIGMFEVDRARNMPSAASPRIASRPGFIATPMTDKLNDKQREAILCRWFRPAGSAPAPTLPRRWFIWLPTRPAYVTGQTLHVNGGMAMI